MKNDIPAFARSEANTTELRGDCPRHTVNVLDAVSLARNINRNALVNEILGKWAKERAHEASLVQKLAGFNPDTAESSGVHQ